MNSRTVLALVTKFIQALSGGMIGTELMKRLVVGLDCRTVMRRSFRWFIGPVVFAGIIGISRLEMVEPLNVWADETKQTTNEPSSSTPSSIEERTVWNPLSWK